MEATNYVTWSTEIELPNAQATWDLAHELRGGFSAGDTVLLSGPIGAGKSHFARGLIHGLLADNDKVEDIPSPTFTLIQTYHAGKLDIWHCDLYRLTSADEAAELGLIDALETALCIVEWPDRLGDETPHDALFLNFELCENVEERRLKIVTKGSKWSWVRAVLDKIYD